MTHPLVMVFAATLLVSTAGRAAAQEDSVYDCRNLETSAELPVLEGMNGVFYRLNLNLRTFHPLSEAAAQSVGELSRALAERGTHLIYVPVPTKSLAMPQFLPAHVAEYGFDAELAQNSYLDFLSKLEEAGVTTVDTVAHMQALPDDRLTFSPLDFHWTPAGSGAVAKGVAEIIATLPELEGVERTEFEMVSTGFEEVISPLRTHIQNYCRDGLPIVETERFDLIETVKDATTGGIFATDDSSPPIALVGTSMSQDPAFNFANALSAEARLQVANYAITGGNQFGSIVSYVMSDEFDRYAPRVLVWENPIYNNLGNFGEVPLKTLTAAVSAECTPLETVHENDLHLSADMPKDRWTRESFLGIDTGRANGRRAETLFHTSDGLFERTVTERSDRFEPSRWFYEYARPLLRDDFIRVEVMLDQPATPDATLSTCILKETQS